jgi:hypothetical protein
MKAKYSIMVREGKNAHDSEWMQVNSDPGMWVEQLKSWTVGRLQSRGRKSVSVSRGGVKRFAHVYWKQNHT